MEGSTMTEAGKLMLDIFDAIERRDGASFARLVADDFEAVWPPSLPYGGAPRGLRPEGRTWNETWEPLQPTKRQRRMSPRVVADAGDEVVVLWHQRRADRFGNELIDPAFIVLT
jgi:ketosteroid isomerase-like protein